MQSRKRFGQNFLTDANAIARVIDAINPKPGEHIVEIGPGRGALTDALSKSGCQLDVIEIDRDLARELAVQYPKVNLIEADALKFDFSQLTRQESIRVVGNLPYNISTPLLFMLFEHTRKIIDMHFMLQLEVVDRMVANASTAAFGRLSVMTQYYCDPVKLFSVAATAFTPKPKIMSSIVRLTPRTSGPVAQDVTVMSRMLNQAFSLRRKTIRNAFKGFLTESDIVTLGLDPKLRPENLNLADYVACANLVTSRPA